VRVLFGNHVGRRNATVEIFAADVLELDGGVADLKPFAEQRVEVQENARAFRRRNVGDGDMAGQSAGLRAQAPNVQVVNVDHAVDGFHAGANLFERNAARHAFEKDVEGFADDAYARPQDECGDEQRKNGIDPVAAGEKDANAASDHRRRGKCVAGHVHEGAAQVDVAGHAP